MKIRHPAYLRHPVSLSLSLSTVALSLSLSTLSFSLYMCYGVATICKIDELSRLISQKSPGFAGVL